MTITRSVDNGTIIFHLEGRLDTATSPELQKVLIPAFDENYGVALDFNGLSYVSSAGLRVLLMAQKTAAAKNCAFKLRNVSEDIMEVFSMTGFANILTVE